MRDIVTVAVSLSLLALVTLKDDGANLATSGKSKCVKCASGRIVKETDKEVLRVRQEVK